MKNYTVLCDTYLMIIQIAFNNNFIIFSLNFLYVFLFVFIRLLLLLYFIFTFQLLLFEIGSKQIHFIHQPYINIYVLIL